MSLKEYSWLNDSILKLPDQLPAALLIYGQRGIAKYHLARALAQTLLCQKPVATGIPCGNCQGCHLFSVGNHPDFRQLQPEADMDDAPDSKAARSGTKKPSTVIGVEAVRALAGLVTTAAHRGGAKVILISPAEALNQSAGNALLKMLEEPGRDTYFILVSNDRNRILATVRSRCFQLPVRVAPGVADISWPNEHDQRRGQVALSLSSNAPLAARELAGDDTFWAGRDALVDHLTNDSSSPIDIAGVAESLEPALLARMLNMWLFDLLSVQQGGDVRYHQDRRDDLERLACRLKGTELCRWGDEVREFNRAADHPLNRRLALESLFAGWPGSAPGRMAANR
ncbi:MAG: hypothetical protein PVH05_14900 [Burkholderiales bacterium]|jgi:DNA polymerase-3 subunit delta'